MTKPIIGTEIKPLVATDFHFGAVILAAGFSTRMGKPKMTLPWGGTTILGRLISQWTAVGTTQLAVVIRPDAVEIQSELDRLHFPQENRIPNPNAKQGMFSSIQCAANWPAWDDHLKAFALVLGDQPHLQQQTLEQLRDFAAQHKTLICQPELDRRARHPVFLPRPIFCELQVTVAETLKDFLSEKADISRTVGINDPGLLLDLDKPADYEQAVRQIPLDGGDRRDAK